MIYIKNFLIIALFSAATLSSLRAQVTPPKPNPVQSAKLLDRASVLVKQREYSKALPLLVEAESLSEEDPPELMFPLARAHLELGYYKAAIDDIHKILGDAEDRGVRAKAYNLLGQALIWRHLDTKVSVEDTSIFEPATKAFVNALGLSHGAQNDPRYWLAWIAYMNGRTREALTLLEQYQREGPTRETAELAENLRACVAGLLDGNVLNDLPPYATPPKVVRARPRVAYTELASNLYVRGELVVRILVDREGNPSCVKIVHGSYSGRRPYRRGYTHGLTRETLSTVGSWEFEPARINGEPVSTFIDVKVAFSIRQQGSALYAYGEYVKEK